MGWSVFTKIMVVANVFVFAACMATILSPGGLTVPARPEPADATGVALFCTLFVLANVVLAFRADHTDH